ncbi:aconitate hydratase AcnA [Thermostilla marina]
MMQQASDRFGVRGTIETSQGTVGVYRLDKLQEQGLARVDRLPYSIRVLLECLVRNCDGFAVTEEAVRALAGWKAVGLEPCEIPYLPARVILQDFTGVPAVVDLAAMRSAMQRLGGDPAKINPLIPVDLIIDHSVQVDRFGDKQALEENMKLEFQRNRERYEFLRWGQENLDNFRVVPPGVGIIHQVNLEYLAKCVLVREDSDGPIAIPDTLVGTDSHTTMINGLGVLGWGVGGIEAEAVMLGQPIYMLTPEVIGLELVGELPEGATATDLALTVTQLLRAEGVVGKFVEYFGEGVRRMSLADRTTLANMSPEYGATMGFFPIDEQTLLFLRQTGRTDEEVELVERYTKEQLLFASADAPVPEYTKVLTLDLSTVEPSVAGPKRPQDRVPLVQLGKRFREALTAPVGPQGLGLDEADRDKRVEVDVDGRKSELHHGSVVIAAITSCTNTSNPSVMLAAGLVAKKAVELGLSVPPHVKTSLAPGSRVVTDYLEASGLADSLDKLGFTTVGYGCTTCIGNSGPLPEPVAEGIDAGDLVAAAVLSGNRNFEGRISPKVKANYLASPPLVVAYAIAGRVDFDVETEPLAVAPDGREVFLRDIWPSREEVEQAVVSAFSPELFRKRYADVFTSNEMWNNIPVESGSLYRWREDSTYIQEPPFFVDMTREPGEITPIHGARVLVLLGDSVTTDHISPAGAIAVDSPAGKYLREHGVDPVDFNSYGSRRGNDRVMTRGTFANIRIRNQLVPGSEGGVTRYLPTDEVMPIYDAAMKYKEANTPLVVVAGAEYGTGSSRDWAAKGTVLLGVKAVLAASFERIHRSNLVGMGVLPVQLPEGQTWQSLGITGEEVFDIDFPPEGLQPRGKVLVKAVRHDGTELSFEATARIDTPVELEYYRNGGILQTVIRKLL